jgi:peptidoglycan/LPS O-acetylase OafA/YrhL
VSRTNRPKLEALTGLRLFLALNIINYHFGQPMFAQAPWWLRNFAEAGYVGTGFFFVLSGFVISYVYLDAHGKRKLEARKFWIARFSRLYPIYLLGILAWLPFLPEKLLEGSRTAFSAVGVLLTVPTLTQSWFPGVACVWNCPGWSTSADLSMYLIFPLIATYIYPRIGSSSFKIALAWILGFWLLALLAPSLYMFAEATGEFNKGYAFWLSVLKYHPLSRLPEFMVGATLAKRFLNDLETDWLEQGQRRAMLGILSSLGVIVIFVVMAFASSFPYPLLHNGLLLPVIVVVTYGFAANVGPVARWLTYKPFQNIGETSFCMYILHNPIFEYLYRGLSALGIATDTGRATWFFALYLLTVIGVSNLAYHQIEVPARDILRRWLEPGGTWRNDLQSMLHSFKSKARQHFRPALLILTSGVCLIGAFAAARAWIAPANLNASVSRDVLLRDHWETSDGWLEAKTFGLNTGNASSSSTLSLHENRYDPGYTLRANFSGNAGVVIGSNRAVTVIGDHLVWGEVRSNQLLVRGVKQIKIDSDLHALEVTVHNLDVQARLDGALLLEHWRLPIETGRVGAIGRRESFTHLEVEFSDRDQANDSGTGSTVTGNAVDIAARTGKLANVLRERFDRPPSDAGWRILSGDWTLLDAAFVQREHSGYDRSLEYRDSLEPPYQIKTRFRHLVGSGAGLLFGLPDAQVGLSGGREGSHLIRYADDGRSLLWGYFDARGAFIGQGYAPTPAPGTNWHELEVQVTHTGYTVTLDGQILQSGIPVKRGVGRVALQTSLSSAAFDVFDVERGASKTIKAEPKK